MKSIVALCKTLSRILDSFFRKHHILEIVSHLLIFYIPTALVRSRESSIFATEVMQEIANLRVERTHDFAVGLSDLIYTLSQKNCHESLLVWECLGYWLFTIGFIKFEENSRRFASLGILKLSFLGGLAHTIAYALLNIMSCSSVNTDSIFVLLGVSWVLGLLIKFILRACAEP